jgi:hypothetical protein
MFCGILVLYLVKELKECIIFFVLILWNEVFEVYNKTLLICAHLFQLGRFSPLEYFLFEHFRQIRLVIVASILLSMIQMFLFEVSSIVFDWPKFILPWFFAARQNNCGLHRLATSIVTFQVRIVKLFIAILILTRRTSSCNKSFRR